MNTATPATARQAASTEIGNLMADVEDLLKKVPGIPGIDVEALRARVQATASAAKSSLLAGGRQLAESAQEAATATDNYVHRSPWQAIGFAALAGVGVGYLIARR